ncbi:MAG: PIN domain-containing protein [Acidobacteriota bacterium]|nr:PIN domain-containing protein [Acidobacteriota bacterium]
MTPVLLDTGVIVALLDRSEHYHSRCVAAVAGLGRPLVTCEAVIAESCYLLRGLSGAPETVLENVAHGIFLIPFQLLRSAPAVRSILRKYRDLPADLANACLIHLADELNTGEILTLDSDFGFYRWRKNRGFQLLMELD